MHIYHINQARNFENVAVKKILNKLNRSTKRRRKRPLFSSQKKQLDDHFSSISQRLESFSSSQGDFGGKHTRFDSSDSENGDSDDYECEASKNDGDAKIKSKFLPQNTDSCDRRSSCPYPSAAEEMSRLGLKGDIDVSASMAHGSKKYTRSNGPSRKKRKSDNSNTNTTTVQSKLPKKDEIGSDFLVDEEEKEFVSENEPDLSLPNSSMRMFITTWKETCREDNVAEVLKRMLQFYQPPSEKTPSQKRLSQRQRKRMKSMFSSYPFIGLLNVAVESIKSGMWDSIYDTFQAFTEQATTSTLPEKSPEFENIEVEPDERNGLILAERVSKYKQSVTAKDIIKKISAYLELNTDILSNVKSPLGTEFALMRKLRECEFWMTEQFSVQEFESLGYGEFFTFLEKHVSLLPDALQKCSTSYTHENSPLEVCLRRHQLALLLSQASNNLGGIENITKEMISLLLVRQFPAVNWILVERASLKDFMDVVRQNESTSSCILFSTALLGSHTGDSINEKASSTAALKGMEIGHRTGLLGSFTTKDAVDVLLRAPMLADLSLWTHWDLVFAPSLGPLVEWLLNEVNTKELLCLVTKDGKVIRIDHTATVDSFLEGSLQGSSFQTAVKLLSLLSLYGGDRHVPLSLLKCYARQAFEVLTKNFCEVEVNECKTFLRQGDSLYRQDMSEDDASGLKNNFYRSKSTVQEAAAVAARFFIDCVGHFPTEFRSFAADVLLSGLQSVIKDAPSGILAECKQIEQRLMLHDVGLSLGMVEWIEDYHKFGSTMDSQSFASSGVYYVQPVISEISRGSTCMQDAPAVSKFTSSNSEMLVSTEEISGDYFSIDCKRSEVEKENEAALLIESIRCEEFGLDPRLSEMESSMLKKQHARLGRALHCLSQELYSQDSHFLLELVTIAFPYFMMFSRYYLCAIMFLCFVSICFICY
ncbi:hypothetical protein U1Q18_030682 [Sarracenia purpurea var. burkii]